LTGAGALITAVAGLILGLYQYGALGSKHASPAKAEAAVETGPGAKPSAPGEIGSTATSPAATAAGEPASSQAMTAFTATDGTVTSVFPDSLHEIRQYDKSLHLLSGQNVAFDRIKRIDVVAVFEESAKVRLMLTNNQTLEASLPAGSSTLGFHGENELGAFEIRLEKLRQITFAH
jgi:hypothetical protein